MGRSVGALGGLLLLAGLAQAPAAVAGHGLLNAFADVEWLPAAGVTPAHRGWWLEQWWDGLARDFAATPSLRFRLGVAQSRERLAEIEAVARTGRPEAAAPALAGYRSCLEYLVAGARSSGPRERSLLARRLVDALLEQRYILAVDYLDVPSAGRAALRSAMAVADEHYARARARLPVGIAESLFFKEEEVRWNWESGQQGDAQGL